MANQVSEKHVRRRQEGQEPLAESAYRTIREWILQRVFKPGDALVEARLAKELGVSRTPIRETLKRLEQEGLVASVPNKGFFVEALSPTDLAEIYDVREVIEGLAARLLARRITPEQAEKLQELASRADDPSATIEDETAYHSAVVEMCGNRRVTEATRIFCLHVFTYDEQMHRLTSNRQAPIFQKGRVADAHRSLMEKIVSGDATAAEEEARRHVRIGREAAARVLLGIYEE